MEMFALGMGQTLFTTNVCLFMMLTGYLNINKKPCKSYYKGGIRVLVSYLLFSVLTIAFRKYYLGEGLSWGQWLMKITDFSAIPYGWYIEMWIGLFLLTPFLNILWRGVDGKRNRLLLIATLFVMTALPDFTNRYGMYLSPGYWRTAAYPLLYFFLGCYVREYQPMVNRKLIGGGYFVTLSRQSALQRVVHSSPYDAARRRRTGWYHCCPADSPRIHDVLQGGYHVRQNQEVV